MSNPFAPGDDHGPREEPQDAADNPPFWLLVLVLALVLGTAVLLVIITDDVQVLAALGTLVVVTVGAFYRPRRR